MSEMSLETKSHRVVWDGRWHFLPRSPRGSLQRPPGASKKLYRATPIPPIRSGGVPTLGHWGCPKQWQHGADLLGRSKQLRLGVRIAGSIPASSTMEDSPNWYGSGLLSRQGDTCAGSNPASSALGVPRLGTAGQDVAWLGSGRCRTWCATGLENQGIGNGRGSIPPPSSGIWLNW